MTLDGSVIAFQNATLFTKNFKNLTRNHGYVLVKVPVGVAYGSNVDKVRKMLVNDLQSLIVKNKAGKYVVDTKQGFSVVFNDFGDSSVDLFIVFWVLVEEKPAVIAKVKEVVYNTLNKNNIEIPFPQRDVYVRHIEPAKEGKKSRAEKKDKMGEGALMKLESDEVSGAQKGDSEVVKPKKRGRKKVVKEKTVVEDRADVQTTGKE